MQETLEDVQNKCKSIWNLSAAEETILSVLVKRKGNRTNFDGELKEHQILKHSLCGKSKEEE